MKFKEFVKVHTDDIYYDLFDGGYIRPEKLLENDEDISKIKDAIYTIQLFIQVAEEKGVIEIR